MPAAHANTKGEPKMSRIRNIALSATTAFSLAIAPAPVAADSSDVAKVLTGLAILGIAAKVIDDRRDRRRTTVTSSRILNPRFDSIEGNSRVIDGEIRRYGEPNRRASTRGYKKLALPDRCLRFVENSRGRDRLVYGDRCLDRHYKFAAKLPERCKLLVRTDRRVREVYGARCLRRDGWRVASR